MVQSKFPGIQVVNPEPSKPQIEFPPVLDATGLNRHEAANLIEYLKRLLDMQNEILPNDELKEVDISANRWPNDRSGKGSRDFNR